MSEDKKMKEEDGGDKASSRNKPQQQKKEEGLKLWGILIFGVIGATATTFAVSDYYSFFFLGQFVYASIYIVPTIS